MTFHSPQDQYYGGVMLISRGEHTPQLRIEPVERGGRLDNPASPPFLSSQSDAFMGRHAYDVPISAVPGTDTDSGRSPRSSKGSKQSVSSGGSFSAGSSTSSGGGGGGFRGGFKSVKESFRNIGGSSNGNKKKSPSGFSSPTSGSITPRPPPYQQTQQGIIDVWAPPNEWQHTNGVGVGAAAGGNGNTGMMSPPLTTTTDRFNMTRRSPGSISPPAGSGFGRMASPFAYMQKLTGSQTRVGMTTGGPNLGPGSGPGVSPHDQSLGLGSSVRGFGQHVGTHGTQGGGASSAMGLGLAQPAFGRPGHIAGPRSVDVATSARQAARWGNARRSRSIDGIGM
ncbi:hypothetical protein M408DRAFT_102499 [Serendipita vermifera MAFF 305830]|uniref:Uncharacterized protein n=1 Tax=Serendipita vermifera MAFF 305830 TaxID=933852 RepID=A0A0C3ANF7_SERVB|nr:hypothetical protein M408DRAFT_102499 [Serendipita vermifera MAFF 305830]